MLPDISVAPEVAVEVVSSPAPTSPSYQSINRNILWRVHGTTQQKSSTISQGRATFLRHYPIYSLGVVYAVFWLARSTLSG